MSNPNPNKENRFAPKDWAAIKTHRIVEKIKKHNAEIEGLGMSSLTM